MHQDLRDVGTGTADPWRGSEGGPTRDTETSHDGPEEDWGLAEDVKVHEIQIPVRPYGCICGEQANSQVLSSNANLLTEAIGYFYPKPL